jgi:hypothetical protein
MPINRDDVISFISGSLAGVAQVFVMQPFETIKVRQVNEHDDSVKYRGFRGAFKTILREEGFLGFYKGTSFLSKAHLSIFRNSIAADRIHPHHVLTIWLQPLLPKFAGQVERR